MAASDVRTVLDVGCGNGIFTNMVVPDQIKVGLDQSRVALANVDAPRVQANAAWLPFPDNRFDAVVCMEMLEHLPPDLFVLSLNEIQRVSGGYVLITVPFEEKLEYYQVICPAYLFSFHPFHHLRSFKRSDFKNLLDSDYHLEKLEAVVLKKVEIFPAFWNFIRSYLHRKGRNFPGDTICPQCGYMLVANMVSTKTIPPTHSIRSSLGRLWPKHTSYTWWMALYAKNV